ncbi:putative MFS family arabinose efflux permease [Endobacter medicaginis]|uniref:Putative MFS family arabinose efflux permease n=2 Tax=Endobacter medicaginis TaxID=1181271 RepID=A0A839V4M5_9PROT|nr:MFS transporter [Endobacter medicaginis]MBB3174492.1 putative MFS family arabinose efflux permease [Endobacter medicaginis]MCX5475059.1 MFS transporter [Endobacter medicaginis]
MLAMLGMAVGINGMAFYAVGAMIGPLQAAFGWSRAAASSASICLMAGQMIAAPLVGPAMARFGARSVATASGLAMAAGFAAMGLVSTRFAYGAVWLLTALGGGATGAVLWSRVVLTQGSARPGLRLGLALCGTGLAGIAVPLALARVMAADWRDGPWLLSGVAVLGAAVVWIGLGSAPSEPDRADPGLVTHGWTLRAARRSGAFWLLAGAFALIAACVAGLIVHLVPLLVDRGLSPGSAAAIAGGIGLAALVGRATSGWLLDRWHPPLLAAGVVLLPALAALCLLGAGRQASWVAALLIGLAAGAEIDLLAYLNGWCFGLRDSARIHGWLVGGFCLGSALGPPLAGWVRDATGSYREALIGAVALLMLAGVSLLGLRRVAGVPSAGPRSGRRQSVDRLEKRGQVGT